MSYTENQYQLRMKCNMRVKLEIQALPKLSIDMTRVRHPKIGHTTLLNGRVTRGYLMQ